MQASSSGRAFRSIIVVNRIAISHHLSRYHAGPSNSPCPSLGNPLLFPSIVTGRRNRQQASAFDRARSIPASCSADSKAITLRAQLARFKWTRGTRRRFLPVPRPARHPESPSRLFYFLSVSSNVRLYEGPGLVKVHQQRVFMLLHRETFNLALILFGPRGHGSVARSVIVKSRDRMPGPA